MYLSYVKSIFYKYFNDIWLTQQLHQQIINTNTSSIQNYFQDTIYFKLLNPVINFKKIFFYRRQINASRF